MQPARTDTTVSNGATGATGASIARLGARIKGFGPVLGLLSLCIAGTLLNGDFATVDNLMNVLTRTAFIGIIAVGMTFVIISGGIDLSVGSMAALIAGCMIYFMNALAQGAGGDLAPITMLVLGIAMALILGAGFGLMHGLLISKGNIEPFIVTLGTLGIFRAVLTYLADGGALTLDATLSELYSPVYYTSVLGAPSPSGSSSSSRRPAPSSSTAPPSAATCRRLVPTSKWRAMRPSTSTR